MIKEITVAGIKLDNYTVKESLIMIDKAFYENRFTTVEEIGMRTIFLAQENETIKNLIEGLDITVISEVGILDVAKENTQQRKYEIEGNEFFFQLFKRIERNNKSIFLLGETLEEINKAKEFISDEFSKIRFVGEVAICETDVEEKVINDINMQHPDVILSVLPSPIQEQFLANHKDKLLANLWYGVGDGKFAKRKHRFTAMLIKLFRVKKLSKYIKKYEEQEEYKS